MIRLVKNTSYKEQQKYLLIVDTKSLYTITHHINSILYIHAYMYIYKYVHRLYINIYIACIYIYIYIYIYLACI